MNYDHDSQDSSNASGSGRDIAHHGPSTRRLSSHCHLGVTGIDRGNKEKEVSHSIEIGFELNCDFVGCSGKGKNFMATRKMKVASHVLRNAGGDGPNVKDFRFMSSKPTTQA